MSGLPPWVHAVAAVAMGLGGIAVWHACWWLAESPAVNHFFHSFDPLCNRCFRSRRMRAERNRHREMLADLRRRNG